jgi:hypothetical protein
MATARTKRLLLKLEEATDIPWDDVSSWTGLTNHELAVAARALRWAKDLYMGKRGVDGLAAHGEVRDAIRALEGKD